VAIPSVPIAIPSARVAISSVQVPIRTAPVSIASASNAIPNARVAIGKARIAISNAQIAIRSARAASASAHGASSLSRSGSHECDTLTHAQILGEDPYRGGLAPRSASHGGKQLEVRPLQRQAARRAQSEERLELVGAHGLTHARATAKGARVQVEPQAEGNQMLKAAGLVGAGVAQAVNELADRVLGAEVGNSRIGHSRQQPRGRGGRLGLVALGVGLLRVADELLDGGPVDWLEAEPRTHRAHGPRDSRIGLARDDQCGQREPRSLGVLDDLHRRTVRQAKVEDGGAAGRPTVEEGDTLPHRRSETGWARRDTARTSNRATSGSSSTTSTRPEAVGSTGET
jgi:hypothetical protein